MMAAEPMTRAEFNEFLQETFLESPLSITVRADDQYVELEVTDDLTIRMYSERENPEASVRGDTALLTGSRLSVIQDGEEREVEIDGTVSMELPGEMFQEDTGE